MPHHTTQPSATPLPTAPGAAGQPSRGQRWRRTLVVACGGVAIAILCAAGWFYYQGQIAHNALCEAVEEANRLDPGWQLDDLDARRASIPVGQNSATFVNDAGRKAIPILNTGTTRDDLIKIGDEVKIVAPTARLTERQTAALRGVLAPLAGPLTDARKISDFPEGRHPFSTTPTIAEPLPHFDHASLAVWLLTHDVRLHVQEKDGDAAWRGCRAILNVGRSFGDEPLAITQAVRVRHVMTAIRMMERTLAQTEVPEKALADTQELLLDERRHPGMLIALRGHRAFEHHVLTQVEAGHLSAAELRLSAARSWRPPGLQDEAQAFFFRGQITPAHAWMLRYHTRAIEIVKRGGPDMDDALRQLQATLDEAPELARQLSPKFDQPLFTIHRRAHALCGCASAALAAEQYRLKHARWPGTLDDLVAERLLTELPLDPFDEKPLRLRAARDGIVIESIGSAGRPGAEDERLEFRLWDVDKR